MSDTKLDITKKQVNLLDTSLQSISSTPRKVYVKMSDGTIQEVPIDATTVQGQVPILPSGGVMTGELITNLQATAIGSKQLNATTIPDILTELRTSNGLIGSFQLTAEFTGSNGIVVPAGWYNFAYMPHRNGGDRQDNMNYGTMFMSDMATGTGKSYILNFLNGNYTSPLINAVVVSSNNMGAGGIVVGQGNHNVATTQYVIESGFTPTNANAVPTSKGVADNPKYTISVNGDTLTIKENY